MMRRLLAILCCAWASAAWAAAPTLDASGFFGATVGFGNPPTTSLTPLITTTSGDDIIIVPIFAVRPLLSPATVTSVTGCGLTWASRPIPDAGAALQNCGGGVACGATTGLWWAYSHATQAACPVTVNFSAVVSAGVAGIIGVNGASSFVAPFDTNGVLPVSASNITGLSSGVKVNGYSTDIANDLQFSFFGISFPLSGQPGPCAPWGNGVFGADGADPKAYLAGIFNRSTMVASGETLFGYDVSGCTNKSAQNWVIFGDAIAGFPRPGSIGGGIPRAPLTGAIR